MRLCVCATVCGGGAAQQNAARQRRRGERGLVVVQRERDWTRMVAGRRRFKGCICGEASQQGHPAERQLC